ncbi:MAG: hypothetical protein ACAI35_14395 [Candidatus Methylacidiphilales bacterium]|nr:hypothetical protein [Candidatus Methylacidiphilales bacterium]
MNKVSWIPAVVGFSILTCILVPARHLAAQEPDKQNSPHHQRPQQQQMSHQVRFPLTDAAWSISIEPLDPKEAAKFKTQEPQKEATAAPPAGEPQVRKISFARKGVLRRDIRTYTDGNTLECWWTDQNGLVAMQEKPGSSRIVVMKSGNLQKDRWDATLFSWINAVTYKGEEIFRDRPCRRYETSVTQRNSEKLTLLAWIDSETNRPIGWTDGGNATLFAFDEQVPESLVIPAPYQRELDRIKAFYAPPPPPQPNRPRRT